MKKFFDKIYCFSQSNRKVRFTGLDLGTKKMQKGRALKLVVTFSKRNLFISFSSKVSKLFAFNRSAGVLGLKGGYQISKKAIFLLFKQVKKKFSRFLSKDITVYLKGRSWLKKRFLGSFISYWRLTLARLPRFSRYKKKKLLKPSKVQVLLMKNNTQKAFNGCRVRKQRN